MGQHNIKLNLLFSCKEEWSGMEDRPEGKYCQVCSKNIMDITSLSNAELMEVILSQNGSFCGRINSHQLESGLTIPQPGSGISKLAGIVTGVALLASAETNQMEAQIKPKPVCEIHRSTTVDESLKIQSDTINSSDSLTNKIKGRILDENGEPFPFVMIILESNDTIGSEADMDGKFELLIPDSVLTDILNIKISFVGYQTKYYVISRSDIRLSSHFEFRMNQPMPTYMLGVIAVDKKDLGKIKRMERREGKLRN